MLFLFLFFKPPLKTVWPLCPLPSWSQTKQDGRYQRKFLLTCFRCACFSWLTSPPTILLASDFDLEQGGYFMLKSVTQKQRCNCLQDKPWAKAEQRLYGGGGWHRGLLQLSDLFDLRLCHGLKCDFLYYFPEHKFVVFLNQLQLSLTWTEN